MEDFTRDKLENNRIEKAFSVLRDRKKELLFLSLAIIPFFVPFIYYSIIYKDDILTNGIDISSYFLSYSIPMCLFSFFVGVGISGVMYSIRRMLYSETQKFPYYFFKGIKNSGFEMGLFMMIFFILYSILDNLEKYLFVLTNNIIFFILFKIIEIVVLYIFIFIFSSIVTYKNSFVLVFSDGLKYSFKNKKYIVLLVLILGFIIPMSLYFNRVTLFISLGSSILFVLLVPYILTIFMGVALDNFDMYINKTNYPEYCRKGLNDRI